MGASSCFETAASPPPQHEADWAGAHGPPVGKGYHVRALPPMWPLLLGLSCPLPLRERAHWSARELEWVRGTFRAPSPIIARGNTELPSPARGEGTISRARLRLQPFDSAVACGLSRAPPRSKKMCAQDQQVMSLRVPDGVQRKTKCSGAPLIRDRHRPERSTQVGFTRLARI